MEEPRASRQIANRHDRQYKCLDYDLRHLRVREIVQYIIKNCGKINQHELRQKQGKALQVVVTQPTL